MTPSGPAYAMIAQLLDSYGLGSLAAWAWEQLLGGRSPEEVQLSLRDQPEFRTRFRAIFDREANGLPAISVAQVLAYEDQAYQMMREMGLPPGFYDDPDDFANLIGSNVSVNELQQRLGAYADLASAGREQVRLEFTRFSQGDGSEVDAMTDGELAAWMIDPQRALPVLRQRLQAAQVSGAAAQTGFGSLSVGDATRLTGAGVEEAQARQAFGELARQGDVTGALAGEDAGSAMERGAQVGVVAGDARAQEDLERRRRGRQGAFQGGGGFATGQDGVGGLGSS